MDDEVPPPSSQWILPPDDILLEILSRLPMISLIRFRRVSRSWRALISRLPPAMAGIFDGGSGIRAIQFLPLGPRSSMDPASMDAPFSFLPSPHLDRLHILSCCGGLLLLSNAASALLVCNPAIRKWALVPPPPEHFRQLALAFDPRLGPHFKIVSFPLFPADHPTPFGRDEVHVFSSDGGCWKKVGGIRGLDSVFLMDARILFLNGTIHVLDVYHNRTFALDLEEKECRLIGWPEAMRPRSRMCSLCLGVSRGRLHFAFVLFGEMHVWVAEDYGNKTYVPKHRVGVETILNKVTQVWHGALGDGDVDIVAFHSDLDIVFLRIRGKLYSYSLLSAEIMDLNCYINREQPFFAYSPCFLEDVDL